MANLETKLGTLTLKNPVMTASGTFGYGMEYSNLYSPSLLGAVTVKGISVFPWKGNPMPRTAEVKSGMINAIGLQNPGVEKFLHSPEYLPALEKTGATVIVNIWGRTCSEYEEVAARLEEAKDRIAALEINISCPNIKEGGISFSSSAGSAAGLVAAVRRKTSIPLITKLSPNPGEIANFAEAVVNAGSDIISLINTIPAMAIDVQTRKPRIANVSGGLSGPAVKPVAVKMVYDTAKRIKAPIIGMGGISTAEDALEFFLAGASAVAVGTAIFADPMAPLNIIDGINKYLDANGFSNVSDIVGKLCKI